MLNNVIGDRPKSLEVSNLGHDRMQSHVTPAELAFSEFRDRIHLLCAQEYRPLVFCGNPANQLICVLGNDILHTWQVLLSRMPEDKSYPAFTPDYPGFHLFERELWEEYGITPVGHPWLKPVRYPASRPDLQMADYPFFSTDSTAMHEVAVGPVHAGVIEPGHFRFLCAGEEVQHLEIQLGYQHRGIQKLLTQGDLRIQQSLVESIAGDTVIGHGLTYCRLVEQLTATELPATVHLVRGIALELERIAMHLADLSALAGDIAYLSGQSFFAAQRTLIINSSLAICGSRFGKRWLTPGGTNYGISKEQNRVLRATLKQVRDVVESTATAMFADTGVLSRFDATGVLKQSSARELGIVGMAARSAGLSRDARSAYPIPPYQDFEPILLPSGDVYSRARLRYLEISQSMTLIDEWLCSLPEVLPYIAKLKDIPANAIAVSIIEGWRGEIVHLVQTDADAQTSLYKVYDPSFHNWTALALAVRGNGVSDFPVCNKSFNLSYCGFDL